ncbi:protein of unknown function [Streptomyces sp. KY70]|nr:protein of unknown function [Streptomyces sp. KY70]
MDPNERSGMAEWLLAVSEPVRQHVFDRFR